MVITVVLVKGDPVSFHYYRIYNIVIFCINFIFNLCAAFCNCPSSVCFVSILRSYMDISCVDVGIFSTFYSYTLNLYYFTVNTHKGKVECSLYLCIARDSLFFSNAFFWAKYYRFFNISFFIEPSLEFLIIPKCRNSGVLKFFAVLNDLCSEFFTICHEDVGISYYLCIRISNIVTGTYYDVN